MIQPLPSSESFIHFPPWPTLRVFGPDAATWLNGIVTCNVLAVVPERAAWGTLLTKQGKVLAELQICGEAQELFIAVSGGDAAAVLEVLDGYLVMEDAEIEASDHAWIVTSDPANVLRAESTVKPAAISWTNVPLYLIHAEPSIVAICQRDVAEMVVETASFNEWCIRHGVPSFGVDYDQRDNLHAASLERRTVDWQKGCYLGQEVVCMQDMRGKVKRRLVRLLSEDFPIPSGVEIWTKEGGEVVGRVTSSAGEVAIASVAAPHFEPGTVLWSGGADLTVAELRS